MSRFTATVHPRIKKGPVYVLPVDCTVVGHLIPMDRCLHSVLLHETPDTSNVRGTLDTEECPVNTEYFQDLYIVLSHCNG